MLKCWLFSATFPFSHIPYSLDQHNIDKLQVGFVFIFYFLTEPGVGLTKVDFSPAGFIIQCLKKEVMLLCGVLCSISLIALCVI